MSATDEGARPATALDLRRLFDDASQFPPAKLDLAPAVKAHAEWRAGPRSALVGRFLCPAPRAGALAAETDGEGWSVGLVVPPGAEGEAAAAATALRGWDVTSVEIAPAAGEAVVAGWREAFPAADLFLEGTAADVPRIAESGARAKIRTGGLTADAVPAPAAVAAFVVACAERDLPFKATAGLHAPLRHDGQHGFLNLWAATAAARAGEGGEAVERLLVATEPAGLGLDARDTAGARALFESFGTCSISEPIEGLVGLGLLDG